MTKVSNTDYDSFYPTSANVLNVTGSFTADALTLIGGYDAGANGATVNINGTNITLYSIYGGKNNGSVTGNHVNFLGGTTIFTPETAIITGGYGSGTVTDNHVNISEGSTVMYNGGNGGYGSMIKGGESSSGDAEANTVTISGTLEPTSSGILAIYGGQSTAASKSAKNNSVTITGNAAINTTAATDRIYIAGGVTNGETTGNTVTISGNSTFGSGTVHINGGAGGVANDNTVTISGGTVKGYIYGGYGDTEASGNTVTIEKDAVLDSETRIYGGMAVDYSVNPAVYGTANNNTINILKAITVKHILGGEGSTATGNTLNIAAKNVTVGDEGVVGFQNMNFYLPSDIASGDTMLTINSSATDLTGVTIGTAAQTGVNLNQGDTVTLISNTNGFTGTAATTTLTTAPKATSLTVDTSYKFAITQEATAVTATVADKTETSNTDRAKSLVETRAAGTTFVNAGADMLASQGFAQAANAVAIEAAENVSKEAAGAPAANAFTPFAAFGGSSFRAQTGSYVDTKGFGLNVGFAREISNPQGKLLFGPIVEYGGGSYDSYLEDAAGTHGEGGSHYFGVGIMARQVNHDGLYYEGSLRGGRVTSDYKSNMDTLGKVNYDSASNYWAFHLGVGKTYNLSNNNILDGYLKYFYSHQAGDTTTIHIENAADERGSFDAVDSHRLRIGARLTHKVNERNSFYGGLAYQYEFGGEARAHFAGGGNVPSPSVKGSSGMLELGWQVKPGGPVTIDLGMTGWAGKQRGGSIQLGANWTF
ncbi:autotransporter outer membrane beta-barrel domain-containing protein [Selenomonas ruminantium]|uniref:autotransporter outer membrane beta-barrel domain-containing protein n=1 Tax=Selenomonas ruminantium TaxID=971 RepID=UPI00047B4591|nr:autotransporter outer membrane beta-barrel domain-containing protein [Selenomonas ruminantium]